MDIFTDLASCAYYRKKYISLLLQSTSLSELVRYCVGCNSYINVVDWINRKKCDKCCRFVHNKESCSKVRDITTPFTCSSCQLILQLRNMQTLGFPLQTSLSEIPVLLQYQTFRDTTPFQVPQNGLSSVAPVIRRRYCRCQKWQSQLKKRTRNARYQPYPKRCEVGNQTLNSVPDELASWFS